MVERLTDVICADFQSLVASHYNSDFLGFFVGKQANITRSTLFPLSRWGIESE